jgi:Ca2+-binding EF-hand superfamily protein
MNKCREAFEQFDMDKSGTIEPWELKETLIAMGQTPTGLIDVAFITS